MLGESSQQKNGRFGIATLRQQRAEISICRNHNMIVRKTPSEDLLIVSLGHTQLTNMHGLITADKQPLCHSW